MCDLGFQLRFEEYKEADSVTGQAAHRLSKGIHDKVFLYLNYIFFNRKK